ncbi:MAG: glycosyltransferase family 2 protein [Coraliomargarita sp.]
MKVALSIVAPVYNEADGIRIFIDTVAEVVRGLDMSWELVLVNDGSADGTLEILKQAQVEVPELVIVNLSRNFGHQPAVTAAIDHAAGDAVVVMDADMQDPPEIIPELVRSWNAGNEVVFARRIEREETGLRRVGFDLFHRGFRHVIDFPIPPNVGVFCLLDRTAVSHLKQLPERNRFLPGLFSWVGFQQAFVEYSRRDRLKGEPKQSLKNLVNYAIDGILSFSYKPIRLLGAIGLFSAFVAFVIAVFFTGKRLLGYESAFTGFTTLVILVCLLGGLILVAISLVGEYIARVYDEVKCRPPYIVREVSRVDES